MAKMTEEEANALSDEIASADITLKPGIGGIFTRQRELIDALDRASADRGSCKSQFWHCKDLFLPRTGRRRITTENRRFETTEIRRDPRLGDSRYFPLCVLRVLLCFLSRGIFELF